MHYHSGPGAQPVPDRTPFPVKRLAPGLMRNNAGFAYMVVALYFKDTDFGYLVFDITNLVHRTDLRQSRLPDQRRHQQRDAGEGDP